MEACSLEFVIVGLVSFFPTVEAIVEMLDEHAEGLTIRAEVALFLGLDLFDLRTRQMRPRAIHRLHERCSPLHLSIESYRIT